MLTHSQTYPHVREHHSNFHAPSVMFKRGFSSFIGPVVMVVGSGDGTQSLPCVQWAAYQWATPLALLEMPSVTLTDRHHYPCFTVHMEQNNQAALSATLWELTEKAATRRTVQMHQVCLRNLLALSPAPFRSVAWNISAQTWLSHSSSSASLPMPVCVLLPKTALESIWNFSSIIMPQCRSHIPRDDLPTVWHL